MEILGVPEKDEPRMLKLTQELFGPQDPDTARIKEQLTAEQFAGRCSRWWPISRLFPQHHRGSAQQSARRSRHRHCQRQDRRRRHAEHDATSYYIIVATAGHDTTSSSTAGAIWALAKNRAKFAKVKANPELIPGLVDEAIRWMTPVKHFMRTATADTELGGRRSPRATG